MAGAMDHSGEVVKIALIQALDIAFIHICENFSNVCLHDFFVKLIPYTEFVITCV